MTASARNTQKALPLQRKLFAKSLFKFTSLVLIVLSVLACFDRGQGGIAPGESAPGFDLPDLEGKRVSLADFKGKTVVLNFWGTWCPPCVAELPSLEALYKQGGGKFVVLGISEASARDDIKALKDKYGLTYPFLLDAQGAVQQKYKVNGLPETFIINPDSKISLINDPATGVATARIIGPREWSRAAVLDALLNLK